MKVAYLLDLFPVLSETFIVREILELRKEHFDVLIIARQNTLKYPVYSEVIHNDSKDLMKDVLFLSSLMNNIKIRRWGQLLLSHLAFIMRSPLRYVKLFAYSAGKGTSIFAKFVFSVLYAKIIKKMEVDHLHVHFSLQACTYAMFISWISGIPYSFTVHAHDIFISDLAELIEDKFNNAKFAVCISEYNRQYVLRKYPTIDPNKIKIIHCGLDLSVIVPVPNKKNEKKVILSIGRLVEHKGFKYLIEACRKIIQEGLSDFTCVIIGEGQERQELEDLISKYQLKELVVLPGAKEQADVLKTFEDADIFVLPCVTEEGGMQDGIPVVLMEAMAMGIPVISTRVSGVPELVRNGAGILVEQKDTAALSNAIMKIMSMDDNEKNAMVRRGREIVEEQFNIVNEAGKLAELIRC